MSEVFSRSSFLVESKLKHWASVCISVHLSTRKLRHLQSLITTKAVCCKYDETELYLCVAEKPNWLTGWSYKSALSQKKTKKKTLRGERSGKLGSWFAASVLHTALCSNTSSSCAPQRWSLSMYWPFILWLEHLSLVLVLTAMRRGRI